MSIKAARGRTKGKETREEGREEKDRFTEKRKPAEHEGMSCDTCNRVEKSQREGAAARRHGTN